MRVVYSHPSTSLRFYLNPRVHSNRRLHRGAALRQPEDSNLSRDNPRKQEGKDDYYALLLLSPLRTPTNFISTATTDTSIALNLSETSVPKTSVPTSPRVVFGSRLAGPAARKKESWGEARPQEPDNCCMSGCVNCVWEAYREEVEEWSARQRQRQGQGQVYGREADTTSKLGSNDNSGVGDLDGIGGGKLDPDEFFKHLPVGIKEFIATEKRLKESKSMHSDGRPQ